MIIFKTLRYKNFLSTGDQFTTINLNQNSATLVFGTNGAGKSTMLDALTFGLFGKPYRNINIPQLTNTINGNHMMVEVEFSVGRRNYKIRRGMKPRTFEIYEGKKMLNQDAKAPDYQIQLEQNILKLNYDSFCQVVVLGSSTFVPFMRLPAAERRFIIEDLLDIRIFSAMNVVLKEKLTTLKDSLADTEIKLEISNEKVNVQEKYLANLQADNKKKIKECRTKIKDNQTKKTEIISKITDVRKEIEDMVSGNGDLDKANRRQSRLETLKEQLGQKTERIESEIEFYAQTENCPTCEQVIDDNFKSKMIEAKQNKIRELEASLVSLEQELESTTQIVVKILESMTEIKKKEKEIQKLNSEIAAIDSYITKIQEEVEEILNRKDTTDEGEARIIELKQELQELSKRKEQLIERKHYLEIVAMMLKDSGIKTKIIRQYLPIINKHVNKYLGDLDFFVNFELDETFKESIKSRGRDEFSYESFSEGEKLRIDLALLFTFRDIAKMKNSANTNLLIMDEILDRSLDSIGIDEFMKLMNQLWHGLNIFIISPRGEIFMDKFPNAIKFIKHKNFSVVAND